MSEFPRGQRSSGESLGMGTPRAAAGKQARTRTGCWNCRRRKKKCNERRPVCSNCLQKGESCEWGIRLLFRDENVQTIPNSHPSMRQDTATQRGSGFELVDVTPEVIRDYWSEIRAAECLDQSIGDNGTIPHGTGNNRGLSDHGSSHGDLSASPSDRTMASQITTTDVQLSTSLQLAPVTRSRLCGSSDLTAADVSLFRMGSTVGESSYESPASIETSRSEDMMQSAAIQLLDLGGGPAAITSMLPPRPQHAYLDETLLQSPPQAADGMLDSAMISPEQLLADDGIFLPGSAYLELHSVLRNQIFDTARSAHTSRHSTPKLTSCDEDTVQAFRTQQASSGIPSADQMDHIIQSSSATPRSTELTKAEEYALWKNWIDEIASWLDKFDSQCHFKQKVPALAKEHPHLRYAMLALSARQLERKYPERSSSASLALYQEAIHQLMPQLQAKTTEVVVSCVILCVLEMMSCSPQMWRRHLDGCACLIQSLGIHGFSGGMEQALFWCFARMDVCGGLISSESTLIPAANWTPRMPLADAVELFHAASSIDMFANYAVYLCAQALELFACDDSDAEFTRRWNELFAYIEDWYIRRPPEMRSILSQPAAAEADQSSSPFPTLLFSNPPAISGNQLYHTAAMSMLQKKPRHAILPPKTRPILWHARRICAISVSNTDHGSWTNSVQPLWMAGLVMSHRAEHRAILETYEKIENDTGWGANWRAEDLKSHWRKLDEG